mgnify:FL=1
MADYTTFDDGSVTAGLANNREHIIQFQSLHSGRTVWFKAMITQYNENFASEWEMQDTFGRMDPIATFKRTGRTIDLGWSVIAESKDSAVDNLKRVNALVKMLYPSYSGGLLNTAPLIRVKFANLISDSDGGYLICALNGLSYQPDTEDAGFFDPGSGKLFPKAITLSTQLTILHKTTVGWGYSDGELVWIPGAEENWPFVTEASGYNVTATPAANSAATGTGQLAQEQASSAQSDVLNNGD